MLDPQKLLETILQATHEPIPEMLEAMKKLRSNGFKVGVITNNWTEEGSQSQPQHQQQHPLSALVDVIVESRLERIRKPDERIYRLCCERLGVEPTGCVFLDDIGRNLKPARGLGMKTIKVDSTQKALKDLEALTGINLTTTTSSIPSKL